MQSVNMLISSIINKEDKRFVRVSFMRGSDYAEGILPDNIIEKSSGFSEEEVEKLQEYISANQGDIMERARQINPIKNWLNS